MPVHHLRARLAGRALAAALSLVAGGVVVATSQAAATGSSAPVLGGSITYGADREPICLDPHNYGDMPQTYVARQYLDSLVSEKADGSLVPWLATAWKVSPNGLKYTFTIKSGVHFTDGTPLNAAAVKANFDQILAPATQSLTDAGYLKPYYGSSAAPSPTTFVLKLKTPYSALLTVLSQAFFGIESPKAMARGLKANCQSPVGTGPFIVKQWVHGQSISLVRNPKYNSAPANAQHQGPAYLDSITWKFLEDGSVRFAAVQGGAAAVIFNPPPEQEGALTSDTNLTVQQFSHTGVPNGIALNTSHPPFNDLAVRQAFIHGADAQAAVKSAYLGVFPWEPGPLSSTTPFYDGNLQSYSAYDASAANKLLDADGWKQRDSAGYRVKNGKELSANLVYSANTGDTPAADITLFQDIQAAEKQIGFRVVLKPLPQNKYWSAFTEKNSYDGLTGAYWNSPTPGVLSIVYSTASIKAAPGNNMSWVSNPAIDSLLQKVAATSDTGVERDIYDQVQQIVAKGAYQLGLYPETTRLAIRKQLQGVWIEPSEGETVLSDAWIAK